MSAPPFPMRNILHKRGLRMVLLSLLASASAGGSYLFFYTIPRFRKYQDFFEKYDAYERMREICSYPVKYMHTCPTELMKKAEEKGITIGPIDGFTPSNAVVSEEIEQIKESINVKSSMVNNESSMVNAAD